MLKTEYQSKQYDVSRIDVKNILLNKIRNTPGIRYRQLLRVTGLKNGVLTHHLGTLEKINRIRIDRKNKRVTRYYITSIPEKESFVIGYLKNNVTREIVIFMLKHELCTFNEIVRHIHKAPSTVSWHLQKLKNSRIIMVQDGEKYQLYGIADRETVREILCKYKESLVERILDNYTEMIEEL